MIGQETLIIASPGELSRLINEAVEKAFSNRYIDDEKIQDELNDSLLNINEAARILNVSRSTIFSHKKMGLIPFYRIGRRTFFKRTEILSCLKKIN